MITKDVEPNRGRPLLGALLLAIGVVIGLVADPREWWEALTTRTSVPVVAPRAELHQSLQPRVTGRLVPQNGLPSLRLDFSRKGAETLQRVREEAMARGVIVQDPEDTVRAQLSADDVEADCDIRIKGDWTDHVATDKWSLRIELKGGASLYGMRRFSIQSPSTRGYLWEWLIQQAAEREGILRPRSRFVNVFLNGNYNGVYFLEEHFAKELLESQGRREGPIVKFDESTLWTTRLQNHVHAAETASPGILRALEVDDAPADAFGERAIAESPKLAQQLAAAIGEMHDLQNHLIASSDSAEKLRRLQALVDLQGRTVEDILDVEAMGRMHALMSVFRAAHGSFWHNLRFYHNPLEERLEPVLFDSGAGLGLEVDPIPWLDEPLPRELSTSPRYLEACFRHLGRMARPEWLESLLDDVGPELAVIEAAIDGEGTLPEPFNVAAMTNVLRSEQIQLREVVSPRRGAHFASRIEVETRAQARVEADVVVEAWSATRAPMVVAGFRFQNGRVVPASEVLSDEGNGPATVIGMEVLLPTDGRRLVFRFPADARLAGLGEVEKETQAARTDTEKGEGVKLEVAALYRPAAETEAREEALFLRQGFVGQVGGRPRQPTLEGMLRQCPFLYLDALESRVVVRPGAHPVPGNLVLPDGIGLLVPGGVELRFDEGAVLFATGRVDVAGTADAPAVFGPKDPASSWGGIVVLEADERSEWTFARVERTKGVDAGGWILTGGVTFYESPVTIRNSTFAGSMGEDALNVVSSDVVLEGVTMRDFVSDGFDGDFVTGAVRASRFERSGGDAVDLSGCRFVVEDCTFSGIGDKAVSIGEGGYAEVHGGVVESAMIGVASKDGSELLVEGLEIVGVQNFGLAVYVKKPVYGPARLVASDTRIGTAGRAPTLCQTGCELVVDGVAAPAEDLDVEQLYRDKILGN